MLRIGRAGLHWWEEPCLVGDRGSGAIFFSHCSLGCVYCQNKKLARGSGIAVSSERLGEIMLELQNDQHAANINLVTASHYAPTVVETLKRLRCSSQVVPWAEDGCNRFEDEDALSCESESEAAAELHIPIVWNTSGYETAATLDLLAGSIDIYLVDFKYANPVTAQRLSGAKDYPTVALNAIQKMLEQVGEPQFDEEGYLRKGVIVRHLVLPGYTDDSLVALKLIHDHFGDRVFLSIMNQFTLVDDSFDYESYGLQRAVLDEDYERVLDFADDLGIEDYFWQEGGAARISFIPAFDGTGVVRS